MSVISNGRPIRKDVSAEIQRWLKESAEKKLKAEQEREQKRQEPVASRISAAQ
jgi:hypothetical protein